jgi:diguanylate cyclase
MNESVIDKRQLELRFIEQTYHLRMLGLVLGVFAVGACLHEQQAPLWQWIAIAVYLLVWPQFAYLLSRRSGGPGRSEFRNILFDSFLVGAWIAVIRFNAVPSLTLLMVMGMNQVSGGSWKLLVRGLLALLLGCVAGTLIAGIAWEPATSMFVLVSTIPLLVIYPIAVSAAGNRLARQFSKQNRMLNQLSRTDGLTRLPNRQHWQQALNLEFQRYLRTRRPATLVMLDLDGFKPLNDTYGHTVGDLVLRRVADILGENSRNIDTPGRFGGDELALVMPETDRDGARMLMERVRWEIEREEFEGNENLRVTISIGLAEIDRTMSDPLDWIKAADDALYLAKQQGRNRVCVAENGI